MGDWLHRLGQRLDAVVLDIGGTLVAEAPPATPTDLLEVRPLHRVVEDLRVLAGRVRLAAATNTAVMTEADVRALLEPSGLSGRLEVIRTSAEVGAAKPDPAVLLAVLDALGDPDPVRCLFVGDQATDAAAAKAAGMPYAPISAAGVLHTVQRWLDEDRRWRRPVPLVGDTSTAQQRATDPGGWRMPAATRAALAEVIGARRDVRRFRPDPIPPEVLRHVLAAAHQAPSVGHSQPWRFVVVTDQAQRERAGILADRERLAQAAELDPTAAEHLLDLQLEGLREAPVGVVVACDRRAPAAGVLGRRTFPDADLWSTACAIQNLWLTARAEGLGVGWVTFFQPDQLAELVGLPDDVEPLGWLCLGYPDERLPDPGLERAGWSRRAPLDDVIVSDRWPQHDREPVTPPSKLRGPEPAQVVEARDDADTVLSPLGSLGVLDRAIDRVVARGHPPHETGTLVLAFGRHPVAALGVSAFDATVTDDVLDAARAGRCLGAVAATTAGLEHLVLDGGSSTGNLRDTDALPADRVRTLLEEGRAAGEAVATRGLIALGEVGIGNTTVAAALTALLLGLRADDVVGLGAGADSSILEAKRAVVAATVERVAGRTDPLDLLAAASGPELALLTGVVLGAVASRVPVVLDGLATSVAAQLAVEIEPGAAAHLIAGHRSRERAHRAVLDHLGLEPLLQLRLRAGEGVGAVLAARLLLDGLAIRHDAPRTR